VRRRGKNRLQLDAWVREKMAGISLPEEKTKTKNAAYEKEEDLGGPSAQVSEKGGGKGFEIHSSQE